MDVKIELFVFYELGGELTYEEIDAALENFSQRSSDEFMLEEDKGTPDYVRYPEPVIFRPASGFSRENNRHPVTGKIYKSGDLSLRITIDPGVDNLKELNEYMSENRSLKEEVRDHCRDIYRRLADEFSFDMTREEYYQRGMSEVYPVFCFRGFEKEAEKLIEDKEREITALLNRQYRQRNFSREQIEATISDSISFYRHDCSVIHWNGSVLLNDGDRFSDVLLILELANIQFLKLKLYDDYINNYLSDYMDSIDRFLKFRLLLHVPGLRNKITEITRLKVELEKVTEILDNHEKYFGSWYLARIYSQACRVFEIDRWREVMEKRLEKVTELYSMLEEEVNRSRMLFLNVLTLMLFILWFVIG